MRQHPVAAEHLRPLFAKTWEQAVQWHADNTTPTMPLTAFQMTAACLTLLTGMLAAVPPTTPTTQQLVEVPTRHSIRTRS